MKLEVGEFYLNARGELVNIDEVNEDKIFYDSNCFTYYEDGSYIIQETKKDLIAHIPKELHFRICELIRGYHTIDSVKIFIDDCYKNKEKPLHFIDN